MRRCNRWLCRTLDVKTDKECNHKWIEPVYGYVETKKPKCPKCKGTSVVLVETFVEGAPQ